MLNITHLFIFHNLHNWWHQILSCATVCQSITVQLTDMVSTHFSLQLNFLCVFDQGVDPGSFLVQKKKFKHHVNTVTQPAALLLCIYL